LKGISEEYGSHLKKKNLKKRDRVDVIVYEMRGKISGKNPVVKRSNLYECFNIR